MNDFRFGPAFGRMSPMKKRKDQKLPVQTTIDEFTGGDMLVGANAAGATIKAEPRQGDLFQETPQQLHFEIEEKKPCLR